MSNQKFRIVSLGAIFLSISCDVNGMRHHKGDNPQTNKLRGVGPPHNVQPVVPANTTEKRMSSNKNVGTGAGDARRQVLVKPRSELTETEPTPTNQPASGAKNRPVGNPMPPAAPSDHAPVVQSNKGNLRTNLSATPSKPQATTNKPTPSQKIPTDSSVASSKPKTGKNKPTPPQKIPTHLRVAPSKPQATTNKPTPPPEIPTNLGVAPSKPQATTNKPTPSQKIPKDRPASDTENQPVRPVGQPRPNGDKRGTKLSAASSKLKTAEDKPGPAGQTKVVKLSHQKTPTASSKVGVPGGDGTVGQPALASNPRDVSQGNQHQPRAVARQIPTSGISRSVAPAKQSGRTKPNVIDAPDPYLNPRPDAYLAPDLLSIDASAFMSCAPEVRPARSGSLTFQASVFALPGSVAFVYPAGLSRTIYPARYFTMRLGDWVGSFAAMVEPSGFREVSVNLEPVRSTATLWTVRLTDAQGLPGDGTSLLVSGVSCGGVFYLSSAFQAADSPGVFHCTMLGYNFAPTSRGSIVQDTAVEQSEALPALKHEPLQPVSSNDAAAASLAANLNARIELYCDLKVKLQAELARIEKELLYFEKACSQLHCINTKLKEQFSFLGQE